MEGPGVGGIFLLGMAAREAGGCARGMALADGDWGEIRNQENRSWMGDCVALRGMGFICGRWGECFRLGKVRGGGVLDEGEMFLAKVVEEKPIELLRFFSRAFLRTCGDLALHLL